MVDSVVVAHSSGMAAGGEVSEFGGLRSATTALPFGKQSTGTNMERELGKRETCVQLNAFVCTGKRADKSVCSFFCVYTSVFDLEYCTSCFNEPP